MKPNRGTFEALRGKHREACEAHEMIDRAFAVRCGGSYERAWLSAGERKRLEAARAKVDKSAARFFEYLAKISPRTWYAGVPSAWICRSLTFEDATRPLSEPLSVVPPLAYGATEPMR